MRSRSLVAGIIFLFTLISSAQAAMIITRDNVQYQEQWYSNTANHWVNAESEEKTSFHFPVQQVSMYSHHVDGFTGSNYNYSYAGHKDNFGEDIYGLLGDVVVSRSWASNPDEESSRIAVTHNTVTMKKYFWLGETDVLKNFPDDTPRYEVSIDYFLRVIAETEGGHQSNKPRASASISVGRYGRFEDEMGTSKAIETSEGRDAVLESGSFTISMAIGEVWELNLHSYSWATGFRGDAGYALEAIADPLFRLSGPGTDNLTLNVANITTPVSTSLGNTPDVFSTGSNNGSKHPIPVPSTLLLFVPALLVLLGTANMKKRNKTKAL